MKSETDALIHQLRRANRRWKALALAACLVLVLVAVAWYHRMYTARLQVERQLADATRALQVAAEQQDKLAH